MRSSDGYGFTVAVLMVEEAQRHRVGQSFKNGKIVLLVSKGPEPVKPPPVVVEPPVDNGGGSGEATPTP